MKIDLILPPNPILQSPLMEAPLGVLYLAAALRKDGHTVTVTDMRAEPDLNMALLPDHADMYGVSATTGEYHYAKEIAVHLKKNHPKSLIVIGGPHATFEWKSTLQDTAFDVAVLGEGELTTCELASGAELAKIKGIAFKTGNKGKSQEISKTAPRPLMEDLDSFPFPARDILPYDHVFTSDLYYGARYGHGEIATSLITERGCPCHCSYCANWDRKLRFRSVENVVDEIKHLDEVYKCKRFRIVDDEWGMGRPRSMKLLDALQGLDIHFRAHTRSDVVDLELLKAMKRAGCDEISFGVETADDAVLKLVNKHETVEQHRAAIKMAKEAGLRVKTYFMVCLPGETWETINKTKAFIEDTKPDKWTLSTFIPYPGSDIWANPRKFGVKILEKDFDKFWLFHDQSVIETNVASREELNQHRHNLWQFLSKYDAARNR